MGVLIVRVVLIVVLIVRVVLIVVLIVRVVLIIGRWRVCHRTREEGRTWRCAQGTRTI